MSWENAKQIFPEGYARIRDDLVPIEFLENSNTDLIQYQSTDFARNMAVKNKTYVWSHTGEFAIGIDFDMQNCLPHTQDESPTNVYGMAMLYNFFKLNNIEFQRGCTLRNYTKTGDCVCNK